MYGKAKGGGTMERREKPLAWKGWPLYFFFRKEHSIFLEEIV